MPVFTELFDDEKTRLKLYPHRKLCETHDGNVFAEATYTQVVAAGDVAVLVRVPDLRMIESIINVEIETNPATYADGWYGQKLITGNVVGLTIFQVNAGTTLSVHVVAIGPP